ncbi:restriction endonuclease subunit S [Solimonas marina]|uniref:Restriction endonuclease subunit S n=1 Tax=Solimonas marina TaxID=2714601 RepID=A0A969W7M9_9GAMM|nr:restriction endonuclease subunit S [Solimonas marina]NKF20988.1 restriction endonuclease subunit S [Solimonas marina]
MSLGAPASSPASSEQPTGTSAFPALVPKLRFPEFRDGRAWVGKKLGEITEFSSGGTPPKDNPSFWSGSIPWISASAMHETRVRSSELNVSEAAIGNGTRIAPKGSLLMLVRGSMLFNRVPICVAEVDVAFNQDVKSLSVGQNVSGEFLLHQLLAAESRIPVDKTGIGAGKIDTDALTQFDVGVPTRAEQQKIAECLSTLDELIGAESQKLDALNAHKKGLMQQLFPREGETLPRLRFSEFRSAPAWAVKVGCDLFANRKEAGETGLPIYSVTINDGMIPRASFDRDFYDIEDPAGNKKVCKGDIAYNMMRMWQGAQGVAAEDCMVSPAYVVLAPKAGACSDFFAYLFKLPHVLLLLTATSRGLTKDRLRLYFDDFARMRLCVPQFEEQQRIASCLSSLDDLIAAQSDQLETLKTHKKGLMQQLFPSPSQVEART